MEFAKIIIRNVWKALYCNFHGMVRLCREFKMSENNTHIVVLTFCSIRLKWISKSNCFGNISLFSKNCHQNSSLLKLVNSIKTYEQSQFCILHYLANIEVYFNEAAWKNCIFSTIFPQKVILKPNMHFAPLSQKTIWWDQKTLLFSSVCFYCGNTTKVTHLVTHFSLPSTISASSASSWNVDYTFTLI